MEEGVLQIVNVSHGDQGVFTCVARTPVDRDSASTLLMVLGEPTINQRYLGLGGQKDQGPLVLHLCMRRP